MSRFILTRFFSTVSVATQRECVKLLLDNIPTATIVCFVIAILTWMVIPTEGVPYWLFFILATSLLRACPLALAPRATSQKKLPQFYFLLLTTVLLHGVAWGYGFSVLSQIATESQQFLLITIMCGMVGGATLTLSPSIEAFFCFSLPAAFPLIATMILENKRNSHYVGLMALVFLIAAYLLSRKSCHRHLELILSRQRLQETSQELLRHQRQLEQLVDERTYELQESRESYRRLVEEINDVVYELDRNGMIHYISPAVQPLLGYRPEELIGCDPQKYLAPDDREQVVVRISAIMAGDEPGTLAFRAIDNKGQFRWIRASSKAILTQDKIVGIRGILTGIDREKQAEEERQHLTKKLNELKRLESLGTLAGGIAHDFNNLLMGIQGRTTLLTKHFTLEEPALEHTLAIEQYVESGSNLTRQLLGTARGGKYNPQFTDLNLLIERSLTMFGRTRKELDFHFSPADTPAVAEVDAHQIEQVLLNMFVNSWQAMPDGGSLRATVSATDLDARFCRPYQLRPGPYVAVTITDTGIGMDDRTQARIFDPFYTTKEGGRGTGLGLASAHGIITNHHGCITVQSSPGQGTTFGIYLPRSESKPCPQTPSDDTVVTGQGTILLVDDEQMILDVAGAILKTLGYQVLAAHNGQEATALLESHGDTIQLVLLDMIMPGMDGGKTFDALRKRHPTLPILLSSGYALNDQATEILKRGCNGFIQKPFTLASLSQKIHSVLDGTDS